MPEDMSDRMPEGMPDKVPECLPGRMPEDMPDRMPDRMPKDMSDRMPEDLPVTKRINVMVGMTRSKVIVFFTPLPPSSTGQAETRNNDQAKRERPTAANIHQQHLPKEESKRKARAPTKDTKEQPKKGREGERTRKSKPGKTRSKTRSKRDANEIRALAAANSRKVKSEG